MLILQLLDYQKRSAGAEGASANRTWLAPKIHWARVLV